MNIMSSKDPTRVLQLILCCSLKPHHKCVGEQEERPRSETRRPEHQVWWINIMVTSVSGDVSRFLSYTLYLHVCLHISINHWKYLQNQTLPLKAVRLGAKHWCSLTLTCRPALKDKTFIRLLCHLVTRVMLLVVTSAPSGYPECRTGNKQNKTTCRRRSPLGPPWATALHWAVSNEHAAGSETVLRVLR